jgi:hypothetical protein
MAADPATTPAASNQSLPFAWNGDVHTAHTSPTELRVGHEHVADRLSTAGRRDDA